MSSPNESMRDAWQRLDRAGEPRLRADLCLQAEKVIEATRLIALGARAGLVQQLTGLEKAKVNRLYCQIMGRPSPSGQTPFSDAWYLKDRRRLLESSVVWGLYQKLVRDGQDAAPVLIDVYEAYLAIVKKPLLNLTRTFLVPQLVAMGIWQERHCRHCQTTYLAPVDSLGSTCPGCELYYRYRCRHCGTALKVNARGRYAKTCPDCSASKKSRQGHE